MIRRPPTSTHFPYQTLFRSSPGLDSLTRNVPLPPPHVSLAGRGRESDRKSTRLNSSHMSTSYAVFCLKKKTYYPPRSFVNIKVHRTLGFSPGLSIIGSGPEF